MLSKDIDFPFLKEGPQNLMIGGQLEKNEHPRAASFAPREESVTSKRELEMEITFMGGSCWGVS